MLTAPLSVDGSIEETYLESSNVKTIQAVLTEDDWAVGFPIADPAYSYGNFLMAAAKFPSFCKETNIEDQSVETACKRELATLFSHWTVTSGKNDTGNGDAWTQGLFLLREAYCVANPGTTFCEYKHKGWTESIWPSSETEQYYGRGPF